MEFIYAESSSEMEYADKKECLPTSELKCNELNLQSMCNSEEKANSHSERKDVMLIEDELKSTLDPYCKTNIFDESSDFVECHFKDKFNKNEILCEVCKEIITHLDVSNREIHVNNCIDKQMSHGSEIQMQISEAESIFILECPLCFKQFSSPELRASHIKKCGKSKGLSVQSIIKALELQERHALERITLGLPAKPIKLVKSHKNPVHKKAIIEPKSKVDSDIQLAKALSLSVQEAEATISLRPPTVYDKPGKKTKTALSSVPLLVLRTEEERKRLLLDKISTIVKNDEDELPSSFVCDPLFKQSGENPDSLVPLFWCLSNKASETSDYYVEDLIDWIEPSDAVVGAKLSHLSQIPGHEIVTQLPPVYTFSTLESGNKSSSSAGCSVSVIDCLRSLVASSWMSDVDIHTACGTVIPAHKLLLAVRCPALNCDSSFCMKNGRIKLKWETVSFDAALQFLNFIYTGNIDINKNIIADLFYLANKYEVLDLQTSLNSSEELCLSSEIKSDNRIPLNADKVISSSYQSQAVHDSPEETNVNLDIIYEYIHSDGEKSKDLSNSPTCPGIHNERSELSSNTSQKSQTEQDVADTESNDSQDSVKFLQSSFVCNRSLDESFEKKENVLSSPSPKENDLSPASIISHELNELHCLELEQCHSNVHHFPSDTEIQTDDTGPTNKNLDSLSETVGRKDKTQITSPVRTQDIKYNVKCEISFKSSPSTEKNALEFSESLFLHKVPIDNFRISPKSHMTQPSSSSDYNADFLLNIPITEAANQSCVLHFQGKSQNKYPETPTKIHRPDFFESHNSTNNNGSFTFVDETELSETVSCVNVSKEKLANTKYSYRPYLSSLEPVSDVTVEKFSGITSVHTPESTVQTLAVKKSTVPHFQLSYSPVTPLPDYKNMMTPEIKDALRKIGVKALPRNKAVSLLSHVYNETHPLMLGETNEIDCAHTFLSKDSKENVKSKKRKLLNEDGKKTSKKHKKKNHFQDTSKESEDSSSENPEWVGCVPEISFSQFLEDSPTKTNKDDIESIKHFIQSSENLYDHILNYKPLNLMEFHQELKNNGIKVSIQKLTDFLDEHCITFTCPRKEEYRKKQTARTQRFRKNMIAKLSQQPS